MIVKKGRVAASLVAIGALVFSGSALATNGYFTHGVGAQSKGMAGTGVGSNADMGAIMTASNPALGVFVDDNWEAGLSIFSPRRSYEAFESQLNGQFIPLPGCDPQAPDPALCLPSHTIAEGKIDSGSEWFPIPYVAKNWSLGQRRQHHSGVLRARRHEHGLGRRQRVGNVLFLRRRSQYRCATFRTGSVL